MNHSLTGAKMRQQLIDLDKAYKDGIITEDQYNRLKKEVIKKNE